MFPFLKTLIQVKPLLFLPGSKVKITNEWKHWIEIFLARVDWKSECFIFLDYKHRKTVKAPSELKAFQLKEEYYE